MFSTLRGFLDRHKRKFIVATVVVGGATLALKYAQKKIQAWEEREAKLFFDMGRKKQHFENTEKTCNQTIMSLMEAVNQAVLSSLDTEEILKTLGTNPLNRLELWEELKVLTFARASAVIYSYTILVVALRIQLNIIGGYLYKDLMNNESPTVTTDLREKYLSICQYFISDGIGKLCKLIKSKVQVVVQQMPLTQKFTLKDTEQLFWSIQAELCTDNSDPLKQMVSFFISDIENSINPMYRSILNETIDLMESEEVSSLSISCVSRGFSVLFDQIAESINLNQTANDECQASTSSGSPSSVDQAFVNINKIQLPLIKLIPVVNCLTQPIDNSSFLSHMIINQLLGYDKLKVLGANVYEVFCN